MRGQNCDFYPEIVKILNFKPYLSSASVDQSLRHFLRLSCITWLRLEAIWLVSGGFVTAAPVSSNLTSEHLFTSWDAVATAGPFHVHHASLILLPPPGGGIAIRRWCWLKG